MSVRKPCRYSKGKRKLGRRIITITTDNLDTRNKIISAAEARTRVADGNWLVFAGYFDPLTASVAQRLHRLVERGRHERVLAVVLKGMDTLLSLDDRSILMAALREVDAVVAMSQGELQDFLPSGPRIHFVFDEEEERRNTEAVTTVVLRQQPAPVHLGDNDA